VTKNTPPAFLVHGGTDTAVPPENSVHFYTALKARWRACRDASLP